MMPATRAAQVRCPSCGASIALAAGDTRLACAACGLAAPVSRVGTAPGAALVALEPDLAGATLGGYAIVERIGAGGMGTVYKARGAGADATTDVAIKVLRPGIGVDRAAVLARFAREAAALRRLDHPNVVRFLEHGEDGDVAFIVTELVDGRDLAARLASGPMSLAELVDVFGQVCDGVASAHVAGIVHRDLKPANILVGSGGVKVADFGLAQLGPDVAVTTLTRTDVAMGTFHYLAPEQRKDARAVDHRADIWALGVILYEMLTGELPLGSFAPPSNRHAAAIVRRALAPDPAARFSSVTALGSAVRALVKPRSRRLVATLAAIGIAAGATAGAALGLGSSSSSPSSSAATSQSPPRAPTYGAASPPIPKDETKSAAAPAADADAGVDAAAVAAATKPEKPPMRRAPPRKPVSASKPSKIGKRPTPTPGSGSGVGSSSFFPSVKDGPSGPSGSDGAADDDAADEAPSGEAPPQAPPPPRPVKGKGKGKGKKPDV